MLNRLKAWVRNYFGFSQRETNGFLILLLFMAVLLALPPLYRLTLPDYDPAADRQLLEEIIAELEMVEDEKPGYRPKAATVIAGEMPSAPFDPNLLSAEEWQKLGLPAHLAQRIKNYQAKGGAFKVKEDVEKIYGFPSELYQRLYPFIDLPDRATFLAKRKSAPYPERENRYPRSSGHAPTYTSGRKAPLQPFDLNSADTTQLMRVRGIGSKRAQWIINYRSKLGGFYSPGQIGEVYGLDSAVTDSLRKYAFVSPDFITRKLNINTITAEELGRHPYMSAKVARVIVAYREQHGYFQKPEDLLKVKLMKLKDLEKIRPYLAF